MAFSLDSIAQAIGQVGNLIDDFWVSPQEQFEAQQQRLAQEAAIEQARAQAQALAAQAQAATAVTQAQQAVVTGGGGGINWTWVAVGGGVLLTGLLAVALLR